MTRVIVCGVDGSEPAERALAFACQLGGLLDLAVVPVYATPIHASTTRGVAVPFDMVEPVTLDAPEIDDAVRHAVEDMVARHEVGRELRTALGNAADVIVATATEEDAELIVVGAVGHGTLAAALLGSVSTAVAAHAPCPVVVVQRDARLPETIETIVCGIDTDEEARAVKDVAQQLCDRLGARLELVHAAPRPEVPGASAVAGGVERVAEADLEDARRRVAEIAAEGEEPQHVAIGPPATLIVDVARASRAALVVVGSRGRGPLKSALLGSVSSDVVRTAPCPVVVVPPRD